MAFFNIGDRVTVRPDIGHEFYRMGDRRGGYVAVGGMLNFAGRTVTIDSVLRSGYTIREYGCFWTDEMFDEFVHHNDSFEVPPVEELLFFLQE